MPEDLLEQLANVEVPPPPKDIDRRVHQRLNGLLLLGQLGDLLFRGLPFVLTCFAEAVIGAVSYSLSGRFPSVRKVPPDEDAAGDGQDDVGFEL